MANPKPTVEVVLKNVFPVLGESPHWVDDSETLLFVDIFGQQVHRWNTVTGQDDVKKLDGPVSPVVPRSAGGYIVGVGRQFVQLDWDSGDVSPIHEVEVGSQSRINDGKCDAKGRLWAGTLCPKPEGVGFIPGAGALYSLGLDRSVTTQLPGVTISNGLAWSEDNRTFFFIDSTPRNLHAFDFDLEAGTISNQRTVVTYPADSGVDPKAVPDGMTIDTEGKLWVAFFNGGAVIRMDPETGKTLQKIDFPVTQTTSLSWGGKNLDELYVTTARKFSKEEFQRQPLAGSLFKITGLGARGRPAYVYQG